MKKLATILSVLLTLLILCSSMPMVGAVGFSEPYTYENSFLVTVQSDKIYGTNVAKQLESLLGVETCYVLDMQYNEKTLYQVIAMNGEAPVEEDIKRVEAIDEVVYAGRNQYAWDYAEHESSITLSQNYVEIPVGGTAALDITQINLLYWMRQYDAMCVAIQVHHEICSYQGLNTIMWNLKNQNNFADLEWLALFEDDTQKEEDGFLTVNFSSEQENRNVESPIGQYIVGFDSQSEVEIMQLVEQLAGNLEISSVRIVYNVSLGAMPPVENWTVEDETVVTLTTQKNSGTISQPHTAILQGNRVGQTVVQVAYGNGNELAYATCTVKVVEELPQTPTDVTPTHVSYGDVNGDTKVDAKDALMVLKASVNKIALTKEETLKAELNGDGKIDAKDALLILKKSVNKIDKFPIEEQT